MRYRQPMHNMPAVTSVRHWAFALRATAASVMILGAAVMLLPVVDLSPNVQMIMLACLGTLLTICGVVVMRQISTAVCEPLDAITHVLQHLNANDLDQPLPIDRHGIGSTLHDGIEQLRLSIIRYTDASLSDGTNHLRVAFRGDAATRFQQLLDNMAQADQALRRQGASLVSIHGALAQEVETTAQSVRNLGENQLLVQKAQVKTLADSQEAVQKLNERLAAFATTDPARLTAVISHLEHGIGQVAELCAAGHDATQTSKSASKEIVVHAQAAAQKLAALVADIEVSGTHVQQSLNTQEKTIRDASQDVSHTLAMANKTITGAVKTLGSAAAEVSASHSILKNTVAHHHEMANETFAALQLSSETQIARVAAELSELVLSSDARLDSAARSVGESARHHIESALVATTTATHAHLDGLQDAFSQIKQETDWLIQAQQAVGAVRSLTQNSSDHLKQTIDVFTRTSETALTSLTRSTAEITARSGEMTKSVGKHQAQMQRAVTPLVAILDKAQSALDHIAHVEAGKLLPALEKIGTALGALEYGMERHDTEKTKHILAAIKTQMDAPVFLVTNAAENLSVEFATVRSELTVLQKNQGALPGELADRISQWIEIRLGAATARITAGQNDVSETLATIRDQVTALPERLETPPADIGGMIQAQTALVLAEIRLILADVSKENGPSPDLPAIRSDINRSMARMEERLAASPNAMADLVAAGLRTELKSLRKNLQQLSADVQEHTTAPNVASPQPDDSGMSLDARVAHALLIISAVEEQATSVAAQALAAPQDFAGSPELKATLDRTEQALSGWTDRLNNVATAVAMARDAA
jgi:hypothetical protein